MDLQSEVERLQRQCDAMAKDNSKLRAAVADKEFEAAQLDSQIRRLERKIDALEDTHTRGAKNSALSKGFLNATHAGKSPVESKLPSGRLGPGVIIDSTTGKEAKPEEWWPDQVDDSTNLLLRSRGSSPEEQLMRAMQNPLQVNPDFNTKKYAELLQHRTDAAEQMIQSEGGPTLEQMQQEPLEVLRLYPTLDPNWCDPQMFKCSLTMWASAMGFDAVVHNLLRRRADPNQRTVGKMTCLAAACAHNWTTCARRLLEFGSDPGEVVGDSGETLLMWASRIEFCDKDGTRVRSPFVQLLLEFGADVHVADDRGKTALAHASTAGNIQAVDMLLEARADVNVRDVEEQTPYQIALRCYNTEVSARLFASQDRAASCGL